MGAVYEVIHLETKRRRALKVMLPESIVDPDLRARFKLEVTISAEVEIDHIVEFFDAGIDPGSGAPFLVMELLKGDDLGALSSRLGPFSASQVLAVLAQAASALDATHAAGIVHRDLKPENLFLTHKQGLPWLKILDFGVAKLVAPSGEKAKTTRTVGTPIYMAPEQIRGDGAVGPPADLFALAHIAFALLVGEPYWAVEAAQAGLYTLLIRMTEGVPEPASERAQRYGAELPPPFDAWFERGTDRLAARRFTTASEQINALAEALGEPVPALGPALLNLFPPPASSSRSSLPERAGSPSMNEGPTRVGVHPALSPTVDAPKLAEHRVASPLAESGASPATSTNAAVASERLPVERASRARLAVALGLVAAVPFSWFAWRSVDASRPPAKAASVQSAPASVPALVAPSVPPSSTSAPTVEASALAPAPPPVEASAASASAPRNPQRPPHAVSPAVTSHAKQAPPPDAGAPRTPKRLNDEPGSG